MPPVYLDWAASAPPYPDILDGAARVAVDFPANPASAHAFGRAARDDLEASRSTLSGLLGVEPSRLYFTSGGSEADAIPLLSLIPYKGTRSIVISAIEHAAVHELATVLEGFGIEVRRVRPDADSMVQPGAVAAAMDSSTVLVSVMAVNNETGAVQPVKAIVEAVRAAGTGKSANALVHSDAVQAFCKLPFQPASLGLDCASFGAHKLGGPRGVGALYCRRGIQPLVRGGGQEGGMRPGTSSTAGAWAFAAAAERSFRAMDESLHRARELERILLQGLAAIPGALPVPLSRTPGDERFSPYIVSMAFPGLGGETMVRALDDEGIAVSTGSACSSGSGKRRVLDAMGLDPDLAFSTIRVSTGRDTVPADVHRFLDTASALYRRLKP